MNIRKQTRRTQWAITLFLAVSVSIGGNLVSRLPLQLDLSPGRILTLGSASHTIISSLDDPLEIRFFVSDLLMESGPQPDRIYQLLRQYEAAGRGRVRVERISDGRIAPTALERMGIQVDTVDLGDETGSRLHRVYSGVEIRYLDRRAVVPVLIDPGAVEFEISTAIASIIRDLPLSVLAVSGSREERVEEEYDVLFQHLRRHFDLRIGNADDLTGATPDVILLLGIKDPEPVLADLIHGAMQRGSGAFLALDGVDVRVDSLSARPVSAEPFRVLLDELGVRVEPVVLMDSRAHLFPSDLISGRVVVYPPWVQTDSRNIDPDHALGNRAGSVDFFWPGILRLRSPERGETEPLIVSSSRSWLQASPFVLDPLNTAALERDRIESTGIHVLAAQSSGVHHPESRAVITADSDFLSNLIFYTDSFSNLDFVTRAIHWISGYDELARLSPARIGVPRMDRIEDPFARFITGRIIEIMNTLVIPGIVIGVMFWTWYRRKKRERPGMAGQVSNE